MRAKSIKNKARINAELSPAELKVLLKKAQRDVTNYQSYISLVETELATWRSGGTVDKAQWASMERALGLQPGEAQALANRAGLLEDGTRVSGAATPASGRGTPRTPALDGARYPDSRPDTPTTVSLDKDEREEFLRRENELTDQLAEKETALSEQEKMLKQYKEELEIMRSNERKLDDENKSMSKDITDLKVQIERLNFENKDAAYSVDSLKETNNDLANELEELRKSIVELKAAQKTASDEDKERKKAEKLAALMGNFDSGTFSQKEEEIRATLLKLDEASDSQTTLSPEDIVKLRKQLTESQLFAREQSEKARQTTEDYEVLLQRKEELESRVTALEQECEELLDKAALDGSDDVRVSPALASLSGTLKSADNDLFYQGQAQHTTRSPARRPPARTLRRERSAREEVIRDQDSRIDSGLIAQRKRGAQARVCSDSSCKRGRQESR